MADINTTLQVPFTDFDAGVQEGDQWIMEASKRVVKPPEGAAVGPSASYFLIFPGADKLLVETTSGSASASAIGLRKKVYEVVNFDGSNMGVALRYPKAQDVKMAVCGKMFPYRSIDLSGTSEIKLTFDSARNEVKSSKLCVGVVKVAYYAPYDLWLAVFHQNKATITRAPPIGRTVGITSGPDPEDEEAPVNEPMLIVGRRKFPNDQQDPDEIVCSLSLEPPTWDSPDGEKKGAGGSAVGMQSSTPTLKLMADPYNPVRLMNHPLKMLVAGCGFLCSPGITPSFTLTSGRVISSSGSTNQAIAEAVVFSGSSSGSLKYWPNGTGSYSAGDKFVDIWGEKFSPRIGKPGDTVNMVEWSDGGMSHKALGTRTVNGDEIVICDELGNVIPCYGFVQAEYTATVSFHEFRFDYDNNTSRFSDAWIIAMNNGRPATLQLNGPNLRTL